MLTLKKKNLIAHKKNSPEHSHPYPHPLPARSPVSLWEWKGNKLEKFNNDPIENVSQFSYRIIYFCPEVSVGEDVH